MRLSEATGPAIQVTGAVTTPSASEFGTMLMPRGAKSLDE